MIDDTKVLKLAKNQKGLAQNEVEIQWGQDSYFGSILAHTFMYDPNDLWVEMELARKVTPDIFEQLVGFTFYDYCNVLRNYAITTNPQRYGKRFKVEVEPEIEEAMWEEEFTYDMLNFMGGYDVPFGDLCKLNTYGLVNRNGQNTIVMIDYGLNNNVWDDYYS